MEKKFGHCLQCNKEQEIIVENTIIKKEDLMCEGSCRECGEYICIVVSLFKRNL